MRGKKKTKEAKKKKAGSLITRLPLKRSPTQPTRTTTTKKGGRRLHSKLCRARQGRLSSSLQQESPRIACVWEEKVGTGQCYLAIRRTKKYSSKVFQNSTGREELQGMQGTTLK